MQAQEHANTKCCQVCAATVLTTLPLILPIVMLQHPWKKLNLSSVPLFADEDSAQAIHRQERRNIISSGCKLLVYLAPP